MPLAAYGVLAGQVIDHRAEGGTDMPHYQIHLRSGSADFRVAVNVLSRQHPSELLYLADEASAIPSSRSCPPCQTGSLRCRASPARRRWTTSAPNLFHRQLLRPVPATAPGPDNDLADKLDHYVPRAATDPAARLYAFGQRWGPEPTRDKVFGFAPGNGIHDIHMNQGNSPQFEQDDGVWQDGGLLAHYPTQNQWVAIFLAFQSQAWHTDDLTGHALPTLWPTEPGEPGEPGEPPDLTVRRQKPRPSPSSTPAPPTST
jgi:uncharacterized protein YukJ